MFSLEKGRFTLNDLNNMIPWEREIYVNLILNDLKEEAENKHD